MKSTINLELVTQAVSDYWTVTENFHTSWLKPGFLAAVSSVYTEFDFSWISKNPVKQNNFPFPFLSQVPMLSSSKQNSIFNTTSKSFIYYCVFYCSLGDLGYGNSRCKSWLGLGKAGRFKNAHELFAVEVDSFPWHRLLANRAACLKFGTKMSDFQPELGFILILQLAMF